MSAKESAIAKSKGPQDERDLTPPDAALLKVLREKKKVPKRDAGYTTNRAGADSCVKCKFNLGDEQRCHLVAGKVNNEKGISNFYSPKGHGMLPGDIVWIHVKSASRKLAFSEGHVISRGAQGFQCKDCKYYLYSGACLLIRGKFSPAMSCGYIVKIGHGTEI